MDLRGALLFAGVLVGCGVFVVLALAILEKGTRR